MKDAPLLRVVAALSLTTLLLVSVPAGAAPAGPSADRGAPVAERAAVPAFRAGEVVVQRRGREGLSVVKVTPGTEVAAAARLSGRPGIAYAEPNYLYQASSHGGEVPWGVRRMRAPEVWDAPLSLTGAGVRVAVVDSGVDPSHPQLSTVVSGYNATDGADGDDCGHGTAVAGVIAAKHDGRGIVGVAPAATIVPVKVLRFDEMYGMCGGDNASIVAGIRWAADSAGGNADIINLSLGGPQPSTALLKALEYATARGVLVVGASGNTGDRAVHYPAAYPQVVSVGGIERVRDRLEWWPYSTFGSVDIAAPAQSVPVLRAEGVAPERIGRRCSTGPGTWCSDGTSFASPHVAGLAALLFEQHGRLAGVSPGAKIRRLRQWILGTAPRVSGSSAGVDLHTGHGRPDAVAASAASVDAGRVLLTWHLGQRVLAPTSRMTVVPSALRMKFVATRGTGAPLAGRTVTFTPADGASVSDRRVTTDTGGSARTTFRSTAGGTRTRLAGTLAGHSLAADSYVLQYDDNVPGVRSPASPFRGRLNLRTDIDDVFRFGLLAGETLRVDATEVDQRREYVALYLHHGSTSDVTDPYRAPLRENNGFADNPLRLSSTVQRDGTRYLDVYGYGSYRLRWWIVSPGMLHSLTASPSRITPNGDGSADRSRLSWEVARRGRVTLRIRNSSGKVVRTVALGEQRAGTKTFRWSGRNDDGAVVRGGNYRATVDWRNDGGRRASDTTGITVER